MLKFMQTNINSVIIDNLFLFTLVENEVLFFNIQF